MVNACVGKGGFFTKGGAACRDVGCCGHCTSHRSTALAELGFLKAP